jgi:translation initiation factor 2 subunit 3
MNNNCKLFNLGTLGSVSDGKSEMIYQLSGGDQYGGIRTQRDSREKKRNITIKAGYANIKLWKCEECSNLYSTNDKITLDYKCLECDNNCILNNHISFVDCPGHQELIETMMSSISLMKGAIVVVSVVEPLKQKPQLLQHLISAKISNLEKLIICMNKCDLVPINTVKERKTELDEILKKLDIKPLVIIPTSFTHRLGIDYLIKAITTFFTPDNEVSATTSNTLFRITRSFDINQPGTPYENIKGGCIGGSLISGSFNINDEVEINPGILTKTKDGRYTCQPIITKLLSFESDKIKLESLTPGGLVGILTNIDPYYCKNDVLKGNIITPIGQSLPVYDEIKIEFTKIDEFDGTWNPKNGDKVFLQISNMFTEARLTKIKNKNMIFQLIKPICISNDSKILVCIKQPILKIIGIGKIIL